LAAKEHSAAQPQPNEANRVLTRAPAFAQKIFDKMSDSDGVQGIERKEAEIKERLEEGQ